MELRYQLAIVTGAGSEPGREIAVALSRAGAAVLAADADGPAVAQTARLAREARVAAWSMRAGADETDLRLLAGRARDLGGADLLVNTAGGWATLTALFLDGLAERRGRRTSPAVVNLATSVADDQEVRATVDPAAPARITAFLSRERTGLVRLVLDALRHGEGGVA